MIKISVHFYFRVHIVRQTKSLTPAQSARKPADVPLFYEAFLAKVNELGSSVSDSTRNNYLTALRSLRSFAGNGLRLCDINATLLQRYERWLRDGGICPNTTSCYMRSLRTILSKLLPREEVLASFSNVYTGRAATDKRSVDRETVSKVKNLQLKERSALSLARDIFLFCFYALGMPFVDVAFLRRQQVNGDQIVYYRRKTGARVTVPLLPCMRDIMGRYQNNTSDYVFPLLSSTDPQTAYNEYLTKLNWYNRALKRLARRAGVSETLTSYTTRHTWATTAYHNRVELPVISKALGHSSPQTTLTYLREINDHRLMEANSRIVQLV